MDYIGQIGYYLGAAVAVAGTIQLVKNWIKKAPTWIWTVALVVIGAAFVFMPDRIKEAMLIIAIAQLGYETLIQPAKRKLDGGQ
jgi:uncharacterized membrane protein